MQIDAWVCLVFHSLWKASLAAGAEFLVSASRKAALNAWRRSQRRRRVSDLWHAGLKNKTGYQGQYWIENGGRAEWLENIVDIYSGRQNLQPRSKQRFRALFAHSGRLFARISHRGMVVFGIAVYKPHSSQVTGASKHLAKQRKLQISQWSVNTVSMAFTWSAVHSTAEMHENKIASTGRQNDEMYRCNCSKICSMMLSVTKQALQTLKTPPPYT